MSIARAFQVIERLARSGPSSLRGLARDLDLPVTSLHRMLHALEAEQIVERTAEDEWAMGHRLLSIAGAHLERLGMPAVARPALEELSARTGQTAFLAVRSGSDVVYLDKVQADVQVQLYVELGARRPAHCTALGKAMLAHLPEGVRHDVLAGAALVPVTEHTITDAQVLTKQLAIARERGYATDKDEAAVGICCLAAPVFNHLGQVAGAVSIAGTDPRLRVEAAGLVKAVTGAAAQISRQLGFAVEFGDGRHAGMGPALPRRRSS